MNRRAALSRLLFCVVFASCGGSDRHAAPPGRTVALACGTTVFAGRTVSRVPPEAGASAAPEAATATSAGGVAEPPPPGWDELPPPVVDEEEQEGPGRPLAIDERIAEDLDAGRLDAKTAAFYRLLLQFASHRLPEPYQEGI